MGISKGYMRHLYLSLSGTMFVAFAAAAPSYAEFRSAPLRVSSGSNAPAARLAPVQSLGAPAGYHASSVTPSTGRAKSVSAPSRTRGSSFYEPGSASTIFQDKVQMNKKPALEYFPAKLEVEELPVEEVQVAPEAAPEIAPDEAKKKSLETAEGIIKAFGEPEEDDKIFALENAPAPFKGLTAAIELGDDELAARYARRYARYLRDLKERGMDSVAYIGAALEEEGMLGPKSWVDNPQFGKQRELMKGTEQQSELERETSRIANLDPKTREMLERAQQAEEMESNPAAGSVAKQAAAPQLSEEAQRAQIRQALLGKVPVDPRGEIDIFFFFRPYDRVSLETVPEIEALYRAVATQPGVNFKASPFETMTADEVNAFRSQTNTTFPIKNGQRLVRDLSIKNPPTIVLISRSTSRAVFEEGKRSFLYLDELSKIMRGQ